VLNHTVFDLETKSGGCLALDEDLFDVYIQRKKMILESYTHLFYIYWKINIAELSAAHILGPWWRERLK
jgi:hypothetical protein